MFRILIAMSSLVLAVSLTACGPTTGQKAADQINADAGALNSLQTSLQNKGIYIGYGASGTVENDALTDLQVADARAHLNEVITRTNRILDNSNTDGVVVANLNLARRMRANAQTALIKLEGYEIKQRARQVKK